MNQINDELIAQIASKLFNDIPQSQAPSQVPTWGSIPTPDASLAPEWNSIPAPNVSSVPGFNSIPAPDLASVPGSSHAPLSVHADNLVHQQTLNSQQTSPGSIAGFVENLKSHRHAWTGGWGGDACLVDPFLEAFAKSNNPAGATSHSPGSRFVPTGIFDVETIRKDFPVLSRTVHGKPLVWFDNAATTQKPWAVINAVHDFYTRYNSNIHRAAHTLAAEATEAYENARQTIARFINAPTDKEIVYVRGTTEGINLIAQTYGKKFIKPGDEILVSWVEHHANIVPWQIVAQENGAILRAIPINDRGEIILEEYERLLGPRTRIVALTHASNGLGTILPIHQMTAMAKRYGARVVIDAAQSIAHLPVDVQRIGCDFLVFSGHKIFGPTGIGAVWAKTELLDIMPPWHGGGNMIKNVTFEETTYNEPPAKFEAGTPNVADAIGLGVALDYVSGLGLHNIARHEHELLEYATPRLLAIDGLTLIGQAREKVGVLSFVLRNKTPEEVGKILDAEGIAVRSGHHCTQPALRRFGVEATVRPSLSVYNTKAEIDHLVAVVKSIR